METIYARVATKSKNITLTKELCDNFVVKYNDVICTINEMHEEFTKKFNESIKDKGLDSDRDTIYNLTILIWWKALCCICNMCYALDNDNVITMDCIMRKGEPIIIGYINEEPSDYLEIVPE